MKKTVGWVRCSSGIVLPTSRRAKLPHLVTPHENAWVISLWRRSACRIVEGESCRSRIMSRWHRVENRGSCSKEGNRVEPSSPQSRPRRVSPVFAEKGKSRRMIQIGTRSQPPPPLCMHPFVEKDRPRSGATRVLHKPALCTANTIHHLSPSTHP